MNIRDFEINSELSGEFSDCWVLGGSLKSEEFTWDLTRNRNAVVSGGRARCRFDRVFIFPANSRKVKNFKLLGTEKVSGLDRHASDHFGVFVEFEEIEEGVVDVS
jgi:hypothetical protein